MADVRDFRLPDLGEGLQDATIVSWHVEVGDAVELNQVLCTVETAKAEVEVPSPHAGVVVARGGEVGDTVEVGALLVRIEATGDAPPARQPTLVGYGHDASLDRSRRRGRRHAERPASPADAGSTGAVSTSAATATPDRPLAKPPVRKLARALGVDLTALAPGSGPRGIVTRADVEAAARAPGDAAPDGGPAPAPTGEVVPVGAVRARIAAHMAQARAAIPDATCSVVVDGERLLATRAALAAELERAGDAAPLTPFALLCWLFVRALEDHPELNATWVDDGPAIRRHGHVHLGVATATDRGVVVTVVRDAQDLGVAALAAELARLAERARAGTATPHELQGSTITVSNFGALGLDEGVPIINHPEAAILGVGAIKPRPHVVDGQVVARSTASLTLAFDHRVADGAEAAALLGRLRRLVEAPELALL